MGSTLNQVHRQQLELLLRTRPAQRTSFNTLDNWGHKTPTQSKRTGKKRLKGHSPKYTQYTRL